VIARLGVQICKVTAPTALASPVVRRHRQAQPRGGIAYKGLIFVGKVLSNSGLSVGGSVLAGLNWAIGGDLHAPRIAIASAGRLYGSGPVGAE
jgi:hypothetical protein